MAVRHHLTFLDGLRGLAALVVLMFHTYQNNQTNMPYAALAVDFFFLLSGFVVAYAYDGRLRRGMTPGRFVLLRLIRLYPLILLGMTMGLTITAARIAIVGDISVVQFGSIAASSLLVLPTYALPQYPAAYPSNMAMWSLFFELAANLVYALGVYRFGNRALLAIVSASFVGLALTAAFTGTILHGFDKSLFLCGLFRVGFSFFAGVYLVRVCTVPQLSGRVVPLMLVAVFCAALLWPGMHSAAIELLMVAILFPVILVIGAGVRLDAQAQRIAGALGALSYPLYAIHTPILRALSELRDRVGVIRAHPDLLMAAEIVVSLAAAVVVGRLYDRPVNDWLRRRLGGERMAAGVAAG